MVIGALQMGIANCLLRDRVSVRTGSRRGCDWLKGAQWVAANYRSSEFG